MIVPLTGPTRLNPWERVWIFSNLREPINTWSHGVWLMIALAGIIMLWQRAHGDRAKQVSLLIYGLSLIFCSACSTLYHGVRLPGEGIKAFDLMDHIGIYVLIAGTYTPIAWTFLRRHWRRGVLCLVWFWAALGITIHLTYGTAALAVHGILPGDGMGLSSATSRSPAVFPTGP